MKTLRILTHLVNFAVVALIGLRTINTACFSPIDINLSLTALIFSIIVEIYLIYNGDKNDKKEK